jgi:hypothetical protein
MMGPRLFALALLVGNAAAQTVGDLRLTNGDSAGGYDGLLEVYYNNAWYSVCDDAFSDDYATLVCSELFGTAAVSWTNDESHCYVTRLTGPIVDMNYFGSGGAFIDHVDGTATNCEHTEDVSVVCALPATASAEDQALDLTCNKDGCPIGSKECLDGASSWCCDESSDYPDCGDFWGWCDNNKENKKAKKGFADFMGAVIGCIVAGIFLCVLACCFCCPGCPMYRYGPKDAAAAPPVEAGVQMAPVVVGSKA